eukprot:TRINITY_DN1913_c2_g3_i2.p1 TRINITY_DN1913_c2_g3~~TRINITY_DN1913_c2_g3_i2.p1  ORF type:complete len:482 (+),score=136.53 TRINITY_DN1913_c2_g3_i2:59-1504(+)
MSGQSRVRSSSSSAAGTPRSRMCVDDGLPALVTAPNSPPPPSWHSPFTLVGLARPVRTQVLAMGGVWLTTTMAIVLQVFTESDCVAECCQQTWTPERGSVVHEWELHCKEGSALWGGLFGGSFFFGCFFGAAGGGMLSDRFGRRLVALWSNAALAACLLATAASPSPMFYTATRFVSGGLVTAAAVSSFVLAAEWLPPSWKGSVGAAFFPAAFAVGEILTAAFAAAVQPWRMLSVCCAVCIGGVAAAIKLWSEESPVWLSTQGRQQEASAALRRVHGASAAGLVDTDESGAAAPTGPPPAPVPAVGMLLPMMFLWFSAGCTYYGLTLSSGGLGGNLYVTAVLSAVVEVPAAGLAMWSVEHPRVGRRGACVLCYALGGALCLLALVTSGGLRTACALFGKLWVSVAFNAIWVYTGELFEAATRTSSVGMCSAAARVGAMAAPPLLSVLGTTSAAATFGLSSLGSSVVAFMMLPETLPRLREQ